MSALAALNAKGYTFSKEQTRKLLNPAELALFDAGINAWLEKRVFHRDDDGLIVDQLGLEPPWE
jgi:hypothetical protein